MGDCYLLASDVEDPSRAQDEVDAELSAMLALAASATLPEMLATGFLVLGIGACSAPVPIFPEVHTELRMMWNAPFSELWSCYFLGRCRCPPGGTCSRDASLPADCSLLEGSTKALFEDFITLFETRVEILQCCGSSCFRPPRYAGQVKADTPRMNELRTAIECPGSDDVYVSVPAKISLAQTFRR